MFADAPDSKLLQRDAIGCYLQRRMAPRKGLLAVVATALAVSLSACGGDDDDSLPETPVITPAETSAAGSEPAGDLASQGDDICAETNTAVGAVQSAESDTATELSQTADLYEEMMASLADLEGAADDTAFQDVLTAGDAFVQAEKDAELAAQRGDDTALVSAQDEAATAFDDFSSAAATYGFEECGGAPTDPAETSEVTDDPGAVVPVTPTEPVPVPVEPVPVEPLPVVPTEPVPVEPVVPTPVPVDPSGGSAVPPPAPAPSGGSSSGGVGPG